MLQTCPFPSPHPPLLPLLSPHLQRWTGTWTSRSSRPYRPPQWTASLVRERLAEVSALHPPSLVTLEHGYKGEGGEEEGWEGEGLGRAFTGHLTTPMRRPFLHHHAHVHTPAHPPVPPADSPHVCSHRTPSEQSTSFIFLFIYISLLSSCLLSLQHFALFQPIIPFFYSSVIPILFITSSPVYNFILNDYRLILIISISKGDLQQRILSCFGAVHRNVENVCTLNARTRHQSTTQTHAEISWLRWSMTARTSISGVTSAAVQVAWTHDTHCWLMLELTWSFFYTHYDKLSYGLQT